MNIVTNYAASHDASFCFIVKKKLFYIKLERPYQIKHFGYMHTINMPRPWPRSESRQYFIKKYLYPFLNYSFKKDMDYNLWTEKYDIDHHLRHAFSVDFFEEKPCDVHIVIDGGGSYKWYSVFRNSKIVDFGLLSETGGSLGYGLSYSGQRLDIPGDSLDIPGKVMGLQSYGKLNEKYYESLLKYNKKNIGEKVDEQFFVKGGFGPFPNENNLFFIPKNLSNSEKIDILHTIHKRAGEIILSIFENNVQPHEKVGYSGGVAQNVIWNTILKKKYPNLVIYPHSSDEGMSIGIFQILKSKCNIPKNQLIFDNYPYCQYDEAPDTTPSIDTIHKTAKFLAQGKIVAWYQGHGEVGPRALGNRSILMDPRIPNGKDVINRVKNRESYRPFGSSILAEYGKEYFDLDFPNPYMLYLGHTQKGDLDAITHVDGTSRCQTVDSSCGYFRTLLEHFFELTGCPVLLNTSLNEAGKPIAGWIHNAENLFKSSSIDVLVVGNRIYEK